MKITAAVTYEKGSDFELKEAELDDPKDNEVLIRMVGVGVCHTDALARDQFMPVPLPAVLGHEGSGIIEKTGSHVKHLKPGDHVVVSFSSCGVCEQCLEGRPFICERDGYHSGEHMRTARKGFPVRVRNYPAFLGSQLLQLML